MEIPVTIQTEKTDSHRVLLDLGFRIFFLGAAAWALFDMVNWTLIYTFHWKGVVPVAFPSSISWHAYEMVYGFGMAVVAGFLLTAVGNWTGRPTLTGRPLFLLFLTWLLARVLPLLGGSPCFVVARCLDVAFLLMLACATVLPCVRNKQKLNSLLVGLHLTCVTVGSVLYALGSLSILTGADRVGLYLGFYILVVLITVMGRRIFPFFVESSSGGTLTVRNFRWVDRLALPSVVAYVLCEMLGPLRSAAPFVALIAALILMIRLMGWHKACIWKHPLLWVLYLGYAWIAVGFGLRAVTAFYPLNPYLAFHALGAGGIGMMTLGMMARVALGHSGRSVKEPPRWTVIIFVLVAASAMARVLVPLVFPTHYTMCVAVSQVLWIGAFTLFLIVFAPILTSRIEPGSA